MSYQRIRTQRLQNQLAQIQATLTRLYATYGGSTQTGVDNYSIDSGEGAQRVSRRKLKEIRDEIEFWESREMSVINDLYNLGLTSIQVRRKVPCRTLFGM
jgi:hypothetical protein